jgi:SNF2 family DNA or RNA helicase
MNSISIFLHQQNNMNSFDIGYSSLNKYQKEVFSECIQKGSGGLSLPMGFGKTRLSLVIALKQIGSNGIGLVVVSKSLLESWKTEIKKCFGESLKYQVLHRDVVKNMDKWNIETGTRIILTTIDVVSGLYKNKKLERSLIRYDEVDHGGGLIHREIFYNQVKEPMCKSTIGAELIYSSVLDCLIVDEVQKFTNVSSDRCRGLVSLFSKNRWVLSGTMFDEPKIERILGYYLIINDISFPRNLPLGNKYITSNRFKGVSSTVISRSRNEGFIEPLVKRHIIVNQLNEVEEKIYMSMKELMRKIKNKIESTDDKELKRQFSSYLLAMVTYLRQCVISPLIPISGIILNIYDFKNKSELSDLFMNEIKALNIESYLNNEENIISTRIARILNTLDKHKNEKIVLFSSFRTSIDLLINVIKGRKVVSLTSTMTMKKRVEVIDEFNHTDDDTVLLLTYEIGGEGLNLQTSSTVLLTDFWWNSAKTNQAIARVLRYGQKNTVNIYYFTGNTAIENVMLDKHETKLDILEEIQNGKMTKKISSFTIKDIIKLINTEDNVNKINNINKR